MTRSKRFIKANATCEAFSIQSYDWQYTSDLVYTSADGTNGTLPEVFLNEGTTYISLVEDPEYPDSDIVRCGPRCGNLNVTQIRNMSDIHGAWFYVCQSTVQEVYHADTEEENVYHADTEEEKVPDRIAVIASVSLSESGYGDSLGRSYGYYPDK